ncbi:MAG: TlpA family protein disulfide reductase [Bacteroidia bacterium]
MTKLFCIYFLSLFSFGIPMQEFPQMKCENLNGKPISIPDDVKGKKTVVAIALSSKAEKELRAWNKPLYNSLIADGMGGMLGGRMYDANLCFVGLVKGIAKLAYSEIKSQCKKNVDKKLYENFMLTEMEPDILKAALEIKNANEPLFFVLDKDGKIIYRTSGEYSDKKLNEITEKLIN